MYFIIFFTFIILIFPILGFSEDVSVPTVVIEQRSSEVSSPIDSFSIFKVEKVAPKKLKEASRQNLSDVVKDQVGVDSQVYCANCGAKRLTINGLKGEHTSILVDGLPLHSAVSSFYGVDNIPTNGLAEIQVMRGAGASLVNPEAIGGTLNLITVNPLDFKNSYLTSIGFDDELFGKSQNYSLLHGWKSKDQRKGFILGGQFANAETWDVDKNKVSESPSGRGSGNWYMMIGMRAVSRAVSTSFIPASSKCSASFDMASTPFSGSRRIPSAKWRHMSKSDLGDPKPLAEDPKMTTSVPGGKPPFWTSCCVRCRIISRLLTTRSSSWNKSE